MSFVIGAPVATLMGSVCAMWVLLGPEAKAYQRNWELRGGRDLVDVWMESDEGTGYMPEGLFSAYYVATVRDVGVVENETDNSNKGQMYSLDDFVDYTMEEDEMEREDGLPYKIRMLLKDRTGRELQVHARMSEDYIDIEEGMAVVGVLLSTEPEFGSLAALTDLFVPELGVWVGDYPYLDKRNFVREMEDDEELMDELDDEEAYYEERYGNDGDSSASGDTGPAATATTVSSPTSSQSSSSREKRNTR